MARIAMTVALGSAVAVLLAAGAGCVRAPQEDYTIAQIPQIGDLQELMRVQYHDLKPIWDLAGRADLTPAEYHAATEVAARVQAVAETVQERFAPGRPDGFAAFAGQLGATAEDLQSSAEASNAPGVTDALTRLGHTCDSCHSAYR